jgi:DNA helicase II / ATP-dependent DNA helicase PcrA
MPAAIEVSDEDIAYAENLLLPPGATFDAERRVFIRRFDTLDLQAVPGSGKTTALLAKLVILERHLPFADGSGILMLSHTNAAMDEIRASIGHLCPRLFAYPNFAGTIQAFVDHFLAIPYYCRASGKRPLRIHNDLYEAKAGAFMKYQPAGFSADETTRAKHFLATTLAATSMRYALDPDKCILLQRVNGKPLNVAKPKAKGAANDWTGAEKDRVTAWLLGFKRHLLEEGVLCFDDAYYLAHRYLAVFPGIVEILRLRFCNVFVDEMQDMADHQSALLERLFGPGQGSPCAYQRIGDNNQAIHHERDAGDEAGWVPRDPTLTLANSMRLSPQTAAAVTPFALHNEAGFKINGLNAPGPQPILLVYNDATATHVLQRFSAKVRALADAGQVPINAQSRIRAIAWNTTWPDEPPAGMLRLTNFFPGFNRPKMSSSTEHESLSAYLKQPDPSDLRFRPREAAIMGALVKILRLEKALNPRYKTYFTRQSLLAHLRTDKPEYHRQLRQAVFDCCTLLAQGQTDEAINLLKGHVPVLLGQLGVEQKHSKPFVDGPAAEAPAEPPPAPTANFVNLHGFDIQLSSVHAVKGQTHTATLYFETAFGKDGTGAQAKSYESQRLAAQFLGARLAGNHGKRVQQSAKMIYVGFSRPTHLLCFAVHRDRYEAGLKDAVAHGWTVDILA